MKISTATILFLTVFSKASVAIATDGSPPQDDFLRAIRQLNPSNPYAPQVDCSAYDCTNLAPARICDAGGFSITLTGYTPAPTTTSGFATYVYKICSPPPGTCDGSTETCLDNSKCTCNRECVVDQFRGLSHFNLGIPNPAAGTCVTTTTTITATCACETTGSGCNVDSTGVLGDGACYQAGSPVVKCDNTDLPPGQCIIMTLQIAGETTLVGLGTGVSVSKESTDCNEACMQGPSCNDCNPPPPSDDSCLTRTIGFWGTHPWITNDYATIESPVTVCGTSLYCGGGGDGSKASPSCGSGYCSDVMEGLGSIGGECNKKMPCTSGYVSFIKQLTAAKLNLKATEDVTDGTCLEWRSTVAGLDTMTIQELINYCEATYCNPNSQSVSSSGCIKALDEFNNSLDVLPGATPSPFDRPSVDDFGNVSGADSAGFTGAQNRKAVIGLSTCTTRP